MTVLLLDVDGASPVELAAGLAGAYGAAQQRKISPGAYRVQCDVDIVLRDSTSETLRSGSGGNKLEVPIFGGTPADVWISSGNIVLAARGAAGVAWLIPLVDHDELKERMRALRCAG